MPAHRAAAPPAPPPAPSPCSPGRPFFMGLAGASQLTKGRAAFFGARPPAACRCGRECLFVPAGVLKSARGPAAAWRGARHAAPPPPAVPARSIVPVPAVMKMRPCPQTNGRAAAETCAAPHGKRPFVGTSEPRPRGLARGPCSVPRGRPGPGRLRGPTRGRVERHPAGGCRVSVLTGAIRRPQGPVSVTSCPRGSDTLPSAPALQHLPPREQPPHVAARPPRGTEPSLPGGRRERGHVWGRGGPWTEQPRKRGRHTLVKRRPVARPASVLSSRDPHSPSRAPETPRLPARRSPGRVCRAPPRVHGRCSPGPCRPCPPWRRAGARVLLASSAGAVASAPSGWDREGCARGAAGRREPVCARCPVGRRRRLRPRHPLSFVWHFC